MRRPSLRTRVLVTASVLLTLFFGATFIALDLGFRRTAERALQDLLRSNVLGLLAAADAAGGGLRLPEGLPETRFSRPGSGLYGLVTDAAGDVVWRSSSALGLDLPRPLPGRPGETAFAEATLADGTELLVASLEVEWELAGGENRAYVFSVAASTRDYRAQVARYRARLGGWFLLLTGILISAQFLILRFMLNPLRQAETEVREIEAGRRERLSSGYPAEIEALASNVNLLIASERSRSRRYRETLDNLAHSLKTPLAVIRSQLERRHAANAGQLGEQVERMGEIVEYQLRRAGAGRRSLAGECTPVAPVARDLVAALAKVYADKAVAAVVEAAPGVVFPGGRGDLAELLGNLLDNAYKYCRGRVRLAAVTRGAPRGGRELVLEVEDDGPGIPPARVEALLQRGARGDEAAPGQGIGLALARELAADLGGALSIGAADLGGARITVRLPVATGPGAPAAPPETGASRP